MRKNRGPALAVGIVSFIVGVGVTRPASAQDEPPGWFAIQIGPPDTDVASGLVLDVRSDTNTLSEQIAATWRLADPLALEVEWGAALLSGAGDHAAVLGNPFVGLVTPFGRIGVAAPTADGAGSSNGTGPRARLLAHRGGGDPWMWMAHRGAIVADTRVSAEVGHPLWGALGFVVRPQVALLSEASPTGRTLPYVGLELEAYYRLSFLQVGVQRRTNWFGDGTVMHEDAAYIDLTLGPMYLRLGFVHTGIGGDEDEAGWAATIQAGTRTRLDDPP